MSGTFFPGERRPVPRAHAKTGRNQYVWRAAFACGVGMLLLAGPSVAQVITIDTSGKGPVTADGSVDRRYSQIVPTNVPLPKSELDAKTRLQLIRTLQAEQGFAMRPFPRGHKGLTLMANGKLAPAGEAYLNMVVSNGTAAKPGDRVVITDVKIDHSKIVFLLNGGPDMKHRFLRHIQIGMDPNYTAPVVQDDSQLPTGSRLTLDFGNHIPELTGAEVKALLAPLISFDVKTPIQAFTDTLPPQLKEAILNHHVMVGMSTDMVLFAKGRPRAKSREMDGQMPFEVWIYGTAPEEVDFVRINGNRVIRVEIAKMGQPVEVFTKDEVSGLMRTDGSPVVTAENRVHIEKEGDVYRDPDKEAPAPPPSLRNPGETLPSDQSAGKSGGQKNVGVMKPVQFPKEKPEPPWVNPDSVPEKQPSASTPANGQTVPATGQAAPAASGSEQAPAKPPADGTSQPN
jgi:hypothetical protein